MGRPSSFVLLAGPIPKVAVGTLPPTPGAAPEAELDDGTPEAAEPDAGEEDALLVAAGLLAPVAPAGALRPPIRNTNVEIPIKYSRNLCSNRGPGKRGMARS
jgi:hypothetical protein